MFGLTAAGRRPALLAWGALVVTILIWGSYLVSTRAAMTQNLSAIDVGLVRSVPAAVFLLPFIWRRGLKPAGAGWWDILFIGGAGGTVFTLLLATGYRFAPTVDGGLFTPSMLPVFVALITVAFLGRSYSAVQVLGIGVVLVGALAVGGFEAIANASSGAWRGHLLFLTASVCWSAYTVRFNVSGLDTVDGAIVLVGWSGVAFLGLACVFGTNLFAVPGPVLAVQVFQGVMAGLVANFTFLYAVRNLGAAIPAAAAAMVPVMAAIGGWLFLNEPISPLKWLGICIVSGGVVLASGVVAIRGRA